QLRGPVPHSLRRHARRPTAERTEARARAPRPAPDNPQDVERQDSAGRARRHGRRRARGRAGPPSHGGNGTRAGDGRRLVSGLVALVLVSGVIGIAVWLYNSLVRLRNQVGSAWAQIDVQLKRRHDLIPNLVAAVQGYMQHERELFERITAARTRALSANGARAVGAA